MHAAQIIALLITGLGVGFASGLLGVGGCFIMVPVQFWVLRSIGVAPTIAIRIAFGTNLLVVLPPAFSGAMTHHKKKAVLWKAGVTLGVIGAVGGACRLPPRRRQPLVGRIGSLGVHAEHDLVARPGAGVSGDDRAG